MNRRDFLVVAGATLGAGGFAFIASNVSSSVSTPIISGTVYRAETPNALVILRFDQILVDVIFTNEATFWHRGYLATMEDFVPGDEIIAEGIWTDQGFVSPYITTFYRPIAGRILRREGNALITTGGDLHVAVETRTWIHFVLVEKPIDELAAGDEIYALTWRDPKGDRLVAAQVGIRAVE